MRNFLTYFGLFLAAVVVAQLFVFDSVRVSIWFNPLPYIAFVALLPISTRPIAVLMLGLLTGGAIDFFEGTGGVHTAATLATAYLRQWMLLITLGRETVEVETAMPSAKLLGRSRFLRYAALAAGVHCLVFFSLEALTWNNYHLVLIRAAVSGVFTFLAIWALGLLFTVRKQKRA